MARTEDRGLCDLCKGRGGGSFTWSCGKSQGRGTDRSEERFGGESGSPKDQTSDCTGLNTCAAKVSYCVIMFAWSLRYRDA